MAMTEPLDVVCEHVALYEEHDFSLKGCAFFFQFPGLHVVIC